MPSVNATLSTFGGYINNSTANCTSISLLDPDKPVPIYHDPTNGICYPVEAEWVYFNLRYGYAPSLPAGIIFSLLFGLLALVLLALTIRSKRTWTWIIAFGAACEFAGWVCRTLSAVRNDGSKASGDYYTGELIMLTICPIYFSAACYGFFVVLIDNLDPSLSRVTPKKLTWAFVLCDIVSLAIQATGGGLVAGADTLSQETTYTHIFVAGIVFQLIVMLVFSALFTDYLLRVRRQRSLHGQILFPNQLAYFASGIVLSSSLIIIRGIYRVAELGEGWHGYAISHQALFIVFDGLMMLLCCVAFVVTHPYFTCPKRDPPTSPESTMSMEQLGVKSSV